MQSELEKIRSILDLVRTPSLEAILVCDPISCVRPSALVVNSSSLVLIEVLSHRSMLKSPIRKMSVLSLRLAASKASFKYSLHFL